MRAFLRITIANTYSPEYAWTLNGPAPSVRLTVMSVFNLVLRVLFPGFEGGVPPSKPGKSALGTRLVRLMLNKGSEERQVPTLGVRFYRGTRLK